VAQRIMQIKNCFLLLVWEKPFFARTFVISFLIFC
jgi:hypothetical protein